MSASPKRDRRAERFQTTRQEILGIAWEMVRADGLAALSMRELGARVGMRAQSLYLYFPSKHAIYDAMFASANGELLDRLKQLQPDPDPATAVRGPARVFVEFATEDPARYQLLFQRTIPGFEPSEESYAVAREVFALGNQALAEIGITDPCDVDVYTALVAGVIAQQNSNEPGGTRWTKHLDRMLEMYLAAVAPHQGGDPASHR
jgi:AcrR family transcriptional regulator